MSAVRIVAIEPARDPRWDEFVLRQPGGSLWHDSAWIDSLESTYGYRGAHRAALENDRLVGVMPLLLVASRLTGRRLVSLPFSGPAGPLAERPEIAVELVDAAREIAERSAIPLLDVRLEASHPPWEGFVARRTTVLTSTALSRSADELWNDLRPTLRDDLRRARRLGLTAGSSRERAGLDEFCRLFLQTSRRHGLPPQPRAFFENLWDRFGPAGRIRLFTARRDGRVVNAQVVLLHGRSATALYVGTDYAEIRLGPVKLVDWECLRWASEEGLERFEWGPTDVTNHGLRFFKRGFAAVERPFEYRYAPAPGLVGSLQRLFADQEHRLGRAARGLLARIPSPLLERVGQIGYRHVG